MAGELEDVVAILTLPQIVNRELQPLIENSGRDFNLVGVVMSRVTLIY